MAGHIITRTDRIKGSTIGGALGDAIGLYTEFMSKGTCKQVYGSDKPVFALVAGHPGAVKRKEDGHRMRFGKGCWTDDTDQAVLILQSYIDCKTHKMPFPDMKDLAKRLSDWSQYGLKEIGTRADDVGITVGNVISQRDFLIDPGKAAQRVWEQGGKKGAANGAVMRTSIVGVLGYLDSRGKTDEEARSIVTLYAADLAAVTHSDPRCQVSSIIISTLITSLLRGGPETERLLNATPSSSEIEEFIASHISHAKKSVRPSLKRYEEDELDFHCHVESLDSLKLDEAGKIGYTLKALGSAILLLRLILSKPPEERTSSLFEDLIVDLIMQGGDADSNGQPAGALVGAVVGYGNLPEHWKGGLTHRDWLFEKLEIASRT